MKHRFTPEQSKLAAELSAILRRPESSTIAYIQYLKSEGYSYNKIGYLAKVTTKTAIKYARKEYEYDWTRLTLCKQHVFGKR